MIVNFSNTIEDKTSCGLICYQKYKEFTNLQTRPERSEPWPSVEVYYSGFPGTKLMDSWKFHTFIYEFYFMRNSSQTCKQS